jgi:hypothetical protein
MRKKTDSNTQNTIERERKREKVNSNMDDNKSRALARYECDSHRVYTGCKYSRRR